MDGNEYIFHTKTENIKNYTFKRNESIKSISELSESISSSLPTIKSSSPEVQPQEIYFSQENFTYFLEKTLKDFMNKGKEEL